MVSITFIISINSTINGIENTGNTIPFIPILLSSHVASRPNLDIK